MMTHANCIPGRRLLTKPINRTDQSRTALVEIVCKDENSIHYTEGTITKNE